MAKETILRTDGGKLFDLTKESKLTYGQGKELCRMREMWVDNFMYDNVYNSDDEFFNRYFTELTIAYKNKYRGGM